jgi:diguanylate cyclase (GGDEF)-like protein
MSKMTSDSHIKEILGSGDLFSSFNSEELSVIARSCQLCEYENDFQVFREGDPGRCLYIVDSGEVVIFKKDDSGRELDLARFLKGHCFGELDLLTGSERNARARASGPTSLLVFPAPGIGFEEILSRHPALAARILHRFMVVIAGRIRQANALVRENSPLVQELKKQVYLDKLTGLFNKTWMEEKLRGILARQKGPLAVMMFKPDNYKLINDTWGHEAGDEAIRLFGLEVRRLVGDAELTARFMGNEMGAIFSGLDRGAAFEKARILQAELKKTNLSAITAGGGFTMTISIGIAVYPEHGTTDAELIARAHELPLIGRARGGDKILFPEDAAEELK